MNSSTPQSPQGEIKFDWKVWAVRVAVILLTALLSAITGRQISPPVEYVDREKVVEVERPVAAAAAEPPEYVPTFGWHADPEAIAANLDPARTLHFSDTPAGKAALGDEDVFLWQAVRRVNNKGPPWYPNVNQQSVGCCVGCGWKHTVDVCQAVQIAHGAPAEWRPVSVEVIYGGSRVEVGGGRIRGDGSVGAWAADFCRRWGVVPMAKYASVDLTTFSPARARQFGSAGVPAELEGLAKEHPVKSTALVRSWADVKRSIQQGYPVAVCSDVGFDNPDGSVGTRDKDGFIRARGTWPHCMAIIGVRVSGREGGFILNSWGDSAHRGPVWPADAPAAGFWADAATIDRMVRQGDSFALSDLTGFPARKLDTFIRHERLPRPEPGLALNPEVCLSC
jgi:hypothetical protein